LKVSARLPHRETETEQLKQLYKVSSKCFFWIVLGLFAYLSLVFILVYFGWSADHRPDCFISQLCRQLESQTCWALFSWPIVHLSCYF